MGDLWTPERAWDVTRPWLVYGAVLLADRGRWAGEYLRGAPWAVAWWDREAAFMRDRFLEGAREHDLDYFRNPPSVEALRTDMREEAADFVIYGAMLARLMLGKGQP